jgi:hypothetical protein
MWGAMRQPWPGRRPFSRYLDALMLCAEGFATPAMFTSCCAGSDTSHLRRLSHLAPPEEPDARPGCVDIKAQVSTWGG